MFEFELRDLIDIGLVAAGLWAVIVWLRRARAGLAVLGTLALAGVYLAAREFRLELTAWMLRGFFAIFIIILVVVFQNDLRRSFERLGSWGLRRKSRVRGEQRTVQMLSEWVFDLARGRRGALLVFPGHDLIEHYVEGGRRLDGLLSRPLLMSLFDPSSPGHDGAVIVEGDRLLRFGVHLPLSRNFREVRDGGTRHSAALGLSESTDALCVLVSEETGQVRAAHDGRLAPVESVESLAATILEHTGAAGARPSATRRVRALPRSVLEGLTGLALAVGLWWLFVAGTAVAERALQVPIRIDNIDPTHEVEGIEPRNVEVVLQGMGRELYLLDPTAVEVRLDASDLGEGMHSLRLTEGQVSHPEQLSVIGIRPRIVALRVRAAGDRDEDEEEAQPPGPGDRDAVWRRIRPDPAGRFRKDVGGAVPSPAMRNIFRSDPGHLSHLSKVARWFQGTYGFG